MLSLIWVEMNDTMRIYPRYCMMNHLNHCHRHYSHVVEGLNDCVNNYVKYPSQDEDCRARAYPRYSGMISVFVVAVPVGAVRLLSCPYLYTSLVLCVEEVPSLNNLYRLPICTQLLRHHGTTDHHQSNER